jgi:ubiquinone/menaquinone biosynthesis C-methylase UbiE
MSRVNYDQIAPEYNRRFISPNLEARGLVLIALAQSLKARRILEAGCGTGHWLAALRPVTPKLFGLDYSSGMLRQAARRQSGLELVQASADRLPFAARSFELVYCVDAIHHFPEPRRFIVQAMQALRPGGALAILGLDPHNPQNAWYAYDFFDGMRGSDLQRFPSQSQLAEWMESAGFENIRFARVERLDETRTGREVLSDPYLEKNSSSQMALLNDAVHRAGLAKLAAAVAKAEQRGESFTGRTVLGIDMLTGYRSSKGR